MRRALFLALLAGTPAVAQDDPLPSWSDGPTKQAIVDFVNATTTEGGPGFIAPGDRIATFDSDGTLWTEQPMYFQGMFAFSSDIRPSGHVRPLRTRSPGA
jgi:hypothetical protein